VLVVGGVVVVVGAVVVSSQPTFTSAARAIPIAESSKVDRMALALDWFGV